MHESLYELGDDLKRDVALSKYTTIGVGGSAQFLLEAKDKQMFVKAIKLAIKKNIPHYVLGNGSNTLISDKGFLGLVIINLTSGIRIVEKPTVQFYPQITEHRLNQPGAAEFYSFQDLEYEEKDAQDVFVEIDSGTKLQAAIYKLISQGITGLQWFGGIPASIGGAVFMNAHGGTRFFGDLLVNATLIDKNGEEKIVNHDYFKFAYDYSILHDTRETIVSVVLALKRGDTQRAQKTAQEWAKRKSIQPQKSLGSTFQNLAPQLRDELKFPTTSAGFVIDKILGLRGTLRVGDAIVSPKTANFIENLGDANASDVKQIIDTIKKTASEKIGINLIEEIQYLGNFD